MTSDIPGATGPDPRPAHARAMGQAAALIAAVRPWQSTGPTPCAEFDVRTLLSHIVGGTRRNTVVDEGGDGCAVASFVDGVPDDGWAAAYEEVRVRALKAWESDERRAAPGRCHGARFRVGPRSPAV
ncbi:maleylpyruvate isomerase N-terminal domain-containing protein [Streptomyces sp. NPDC001508]|uniref:maleylpyruvate isomerase N-terminal domain-containing protein n=1 Tax=Streptomyces sp. NPDC001508 TaxID=3154656 RepID=UPI0033251AD1